MPSNQHHFEILQERLLRLHVRHEHGGQGRNADWNSPFINPELLEIEKKTCRIASCEMVFESVAARLLHEQEFKDSISTLHKNASYCMAHTV